MSNARDQAIELAQSFYKTGKPCRKGHMAERYTSNGMCVECLKQHTMNRRDTLAKARGRRILSMAAGFMPHSVLASSRDHMAINELCEILMVADVDTVEAVHKYIHALYIASPTPRALSREDLLAFMDYNGEVVTNYESLELDDTDDEVLYLIHNGQRYNAVTCMDVLRRKVLNVKPEPPKDTRPAWKPPGV